MSKGSGTRSGLLWEVERIMGELDELPQVLLMENVPQVMSDENIGDFRDWTAFLESKGYKNYSKILNAKDYGVAQNRERCFMVSLLGDYSYSFPEPIPLTKCLNDYLEDEVPENYYINTPKAQELIDKLIADGKLENASNEKECVGFIDRGDAKKHESNSVYKTDGAARTMTVSEHKDPCKIIEDRRPDSLRGGWTPESVNRLGFIDKGTGAHISNEVYHPEGLCRTLTASDEKQPPLILSGSDDGQDSDIGHGRRK